MLPLWSLLATSLIRSPPAASPESSRANRCPPRPPRPRPPRPLRVDWRLGPTGAAAGPPRRPVRQVQHRWRRSSATLESPRAGISSSASRRALDAQRVSQSALTHGAGSALPYQKVEYYLSGVLLSGNSVTDPA